PSGAGPDGLVGRQPDRPAPHHADGGRAADPLRSGAAGPHQTGRRGPAPVGQRAHAAHRLRPGRRYLGPRRADHPPDAGGRGRPRDGLRPGGAEMTSIVSFYRGEAPDDYGRTIEQIWAFSDAQLEYTHNYVQRLFPLYTPSRFADAPLLDDATVQAFHDDT